MFSKRSHPDNRLVVVFGASGISGGYVLRALRAAGFRTRATTHTESGAKIIGCSADQVVHADLSNAETVRAALQGADAVYLIPPAMVSAETHYAITVARAAESERIRKLVYVSVLHPHTPGLRHHMRKAEAEAAIRSSSLSWTILQPAMYAQVVYRSYGGNSPAGQVSIPFNPDRLFALVDLRELAEVGVKSITERGHEHASYELSSTQGSMADMVRTIGRLRGVSLNPVQIPTFEVKLTPRLAARSPEGLADWHAMNEHYDRHGFLGNNNVMRMLLGREPATFETIARSLAS
ncbi:SDR family oxidoreductase [Bradyrhizobium sp. DASA03007]|uniref:SDR family oxidoreductase n=1 Tax=unclassified Bradyrhizobium TaxID=2631580 RepID=UPI003F6F713E